jgi:superfamily II DNA/RNA helicase
MKITKQRLKEIIKEELSEAKERTALDDAASLLFNLINRLQHESGVGRPVVVSSRAGEDIDVLEELLKIQEFIQEHRTPALELHGDPSQEEINRLAYGARKGRWRGR